MTILITGGTGFLGSALARLLVERDSAELVLFDLFPNSDAVSDIADNATVVRGDFSEATEFMRVLSDYEVSDVFHLAYYTAEAETFPAQGIRINCSGTNTMFECARIAGVRRVVWPSSAAVYGTATTSADPQWHTEEDPVAPNTIYGACKLFNEHVAEVYAERHGFDHIALRLCAVFGPGRGDRRGIARDFYASLLDNAISGQPIGAPPEDHLLTWGYVKDAAAAFYAAYAAQAPAHRIYNFAGQSSTAAQAVNLLRNHYPSAQVSYATAGVRHLGYVNADRMRQDLGFVPHHSLEEAMADYVKQTGSTHP